jgi:hypothetical protein
MYVFEVDNENHNYDVIVNYHHTIAQGLPTILNLILLLRIFEKLYKNESVELTPSVVFPGCENLFAFAKDSKELVPRTRLVVPSFLNPKRAKEDSLSVKPPDHLDMDAKIINVENDEVFTPMQTLFEVFRQNHIKNKQFYLDENLFSNLVSKCKAVGAKVNSCLEILASWAFFEWYKKHGNLDELEQICYNIVASVRSFVKNGEIDDTTLGLCTGGVYTYPDMDELKRISGEPSKYFWPYVKKNTESLHERLKSDKSLFFPKVNAREGDLHHHFAISNIGASPEFLSLDLLDVSFKDSIAFDSFVEDRVNRLLVFYSTSRMGELKCYFGYNSHLIDSFLVDDLINIFVSISKKVLLENNSLILSKL